MDVDDPRRFSKRGISSVGRAFALHAKGRGFDFLILHFDFFDFLPAYIINTLYKTRAPPPKTVLCIFGMKCLLLGKLNQIESHLWHWNKMFFHSSIEDNEIHKLLNLYVHIHLVFHLPISCLTLIRSNWIVNLFLFLFPVIHSSKARKKGNCLI